MTDAAKAVKNNNTRASQPQEKDPVPLLPGSLMWKDFGSYLFHLMLPQAFILQSAHPVINAAVTVDKKYLNDPWGRAKGSTELLWPVVYSRPEKAIEMGRRLRELHRSIKGTDKQGNKFFALDPEAYSWVHETGFYSVVKMYEWFGEPLSAAQRAEHFAEWKQMAAMLGIAERFIPQTEEAYWKHFNQIIETRLDAHNEALGDMMIPGHYSNYPVPPQLEGQLPRWLWKLMMLPFSVFMYRLTVATLPENYRRKAGLRYNRADKAFFKAFCWAVRKAYPKVPEKDRYIPLAWRAIDDARKHPEAYRYTAAG
ncbi:MAG: DUF2236 domain-containing protein [Pseudomonadales bacterium]|nr:DUF2236 domain-containing protein [Pseudomonadales bacterium]